ncbi:hypothetical protein PISMIDRAFT_682417 [Pisolithus microcarpus 441]|uniref:Sterol regulatory element-binding protein cleavage-activating protein n=1 Tax=Pisolithus microcarpus 441 TaxID=765257 RepID=A0A0C9YU64_9AGAM|nr:WD40-repeat-containing domain protein [Pisolithus microcarpus]KIK20281.1 hypothetical protein PISMIDRAFT_682417 [Pisolithus microcarpus 441]
MPAYVEHKTLVGEHSNSMNTVAFSPCRRYLMSGSSDHSVCIWNVHSGSFLFWVVFDSAVNVLHWHPTCKETLICSCNDGSVLSMSGFRPSGFEKKLIRLGIKAPVFCMDIDMNMNLWAIGVGNQVNITVGDNQDEYTAATQLPPPPEIDAKHTENDVHIRPCSLHFIGGGRKLVASYLNHGIVASSTVCHDMNTLVVNMLQDGICLYKIGSKRAIWKWDHEADCNVQCPLSISFLHGGRAVALGTITGNVHVWNMDSKDLYLVLLHGSDIMQAVATYQQGAWNYIAVGSALKGQDTYIKIWKANITSSSDLLDVFWHRLMILWFSMDLSDYVHVALAVVFTILWATTAFSAVQLVWLHVPWKEISQGIISFVQNVAYIVVSLALWLLSEGSFTLLTVRGFIHDTAVAMLDCLWLAVWSFLDLPPAVHHLQG